MCQNGTKSEFLEMKYRYRLCGKQYLSSAWRFGFEVVGQLHGVHSEWLRYLVIAVILGLPVL